MLVVDPGSNLFDLLLNKAPELKATIDFLNNFSVNTKYLNGGDVGSWYIIKGTKNPIFNDFSLKHENLKII